jgi:hypothetical protein
MGKIRAFLEENLCILFRKISVRLAGDGNVRSVGLSDLQARVLVTSLKV